MFCSYCGSAIPENANNCPSCGMACARNFAQPELSYPQQEAPQNQSYPQQYISYVPQNQGYVAQNPAYNNTPQMSDAKVLVYGILSLAFACTPYISFVGIIFACMAKSRYRTYLAQGGRPAGKEKVGNTLAKVGLIVGIALTALIYTILFAGILSSL